jgi:Sulfotransferase family
MTHAAELPDTILDADAIARQARARTGSAPDQQLRFLPDLERLVAALRDEADLTPAGRDHAHQALVRQLVTQIQAGHLLARHPEIGLRPLPGPVFITGLFRTGTTWLQSILAEHPGIRAPRLWELLAPADPHPERTLVGAARRYVEDYYAAAPQFRAIHPLDARRPEECHRLTGVTFRSDIYPLRYHVPGYAAWLEDQGMRQVYQYHRTLLGCLLWRHPGDRVLLKCPTHLWHLEALADAYPGARVVRLHRSLRDCLGSLCSLTAVVRGARAAHVDKREIGRYWMRRTERALAASSLPPAGLTVLDIRYADLVADPAAVAAQVCDFAQIPLPDKARQRLRRFIQRNPGGRHGAHRYSLADYGLDHDQLDHDFAAYHARFAL